MNDLKIAVMPQCLTPNLHEGLRLAVELGVDALHPSASGAWDPYQIDAAGRQALKELVASHDLAISAVSGWGGGIDLGERECHERAIADGKVLLDFVVDLECHLWQAHIGILPWEESDPTWQAAVDACGVLAEYGEQVGGSLCIETGPEPPWVLKRLMETIHSPALSINYDPANLIIWPVILCQIQGRPYDRAWADEHFNPERGAELLGPWITHTHAKDARITEALNHQEVPLGDGDLDWPRYVANLRAAGFDGYFAIEREVGDDRVADARRGVEFLRGISVA